VVASKVVDSKAVVAASKAAANRGEASKVEAEVSSGAVSVAVAVVSKAEGVNRAVAEGVAIRHPVVEKKSSRTDVLAAISSKIVKLKYPPNYKIEWLVFRNKNSTLKL
jgi:hypothetical protein